MEPFVLLAIITLVLCVVGAGAFVATRQRRHGFDEPPVVDRDLSESQVQQIESALRGGDAEAPELRVRLNKTRGVFSGYFASVRSRGGIDQAVWDDLEEALLRSDVGVRTSTDLLEELKSQVKSEKITEPDALLEQLKQNMKASLANVDRELRTKGDGDGPIVWLFVGVNGVGKTTTIGKLGLRMHNDNKRVIMAAGDTFRAAAAEQLAVWAERCDAELVRGREGGDPGAIIFDAVEHARASKADIVLADTAGRLHNKFNLMEELRKIKRIASREPAQLAEVLLVLDATTGQNGLSQARQFLEAVECTGVVLTKLDGSAKGGIALAIEREFQLPIKLVGLGEANTDLIDFVPNDFVDALFAS